MTPLLSVRKTALVLAVSERRVWQFIAEDELVEVTPKALRVRKRVLREQDRRRLTKK